MNGPGMWLLLVSVLVAALAVSAEIRRRAKKGVSQEAKLWQARVSSSAYAKVDRDAASHDLWEHIRGDFWFALLRRLTGMAPLVGVLVSALAFWMVEGTSAASVDAGGMEVLQSLRPAFSGVVIGALWAIINQIIVLRMEHWAHLQVEAAVATCDAEKIGSEKGLPDDLEAKLRDFGRAVAASYDALVTMHERFASGAHEALGRCVEGAGRLEASATVAAERLEIASREHFERSGEVTAQYVKVVSSMTKKLEKLDAKITQYLTEAADANLSARDGIQAALAETSALVSGYRSEIERSLASWSASAERQVEAWKAISVAASEESVAAIRGSVQGLSASITAAVEGLSASLAKQHEAGSASLSQSMSAVGGELSGSVSKMAVLASGVSDATSSLSQMRIELRNSLADIAAQADRMARATEQMRDASAAIVGRESSLGVQAESAARNIEEVGSQFARWAAEVREAQSRNAALFESMAQRLQVSLQQFRTPGPDAVGQSDAIRT